MEYTWKVDENTVQGPVVVKGPAIGKPIEADFAVDWHVPRSPDHPEWPTRIKSAAVDCQEGPPGVAPNDPLYRFVDIEARPLGDATVPFGARLYSFDRKIHLRASVIFQMQDPRSQRWYDLTPTSRFQVELPLIVEAKPEEPNEPWDALCEYGVEDPHVRVLELPVGEPFHYRALINAFDKPIREVRAATIKCTNKAAPCNHPHAIKDLQPTVAAEPFRDGSGVVVTPGNLKAYERYCVALDLGYKVIIYVMTVPGA